MYTVAHQFPANRAVYFIIYTRILGKSALNFIRDFIGNLALVYINVVSYKHLRANETSEVLVCRLLL